MVYIPTRVVLQELEISEVFLFLTFFLVKKTDGSLGLVIHEITINHCLMFGVFCLCLLSYHVVNYINHIENFYNGPTYHQGGPPNT